MIHYIWQGILLIITHFAGWIQLYFWALPLYAFCSFAVIEISLIINYHHPISMAPFYLSVIPFGIFHILAREAHPIFGILWYASIISIGLQIGTEQSYRFLLILYVLFIRKIRYECLLTFL